jgi:hypothetical protein
MSTDEEIQASQLPRQSDLASSIKESIDSILNGGSDPPTSGRVLTSLDDVAKAQDINDRQVDTELKRLYAKRFIWICVGLLASMNIVFFLKGFGKVYYEKGDLQLFVAGTLGEVFGIVLVITKYLFSKK